jgi:O-antigen ligase
MSYMLSFAHIIKLITSISVFILAYNGVRQAKDMLTILYALTFSALIPLMYGFHQFFNREIYSYHLHKFVQSTRIDSIMGVANEYGVFLVVSLIASICLYLVKKHKILLIYSSLIIIQIVLSLNRGTWIALLFAVMVASVFYRRKIKLWILVPVLVIVFLCFSSIFIERFSSLTKKDQYGQSQNTFSGRIEYWNKLIPLIVGKPFIGHGFGVADLVAGEKLKVRNVPHNDYLRLALEAGIPAFLLYFMFLIMELIRSIRLAMQETNWQLNLSVFILVVYFITISLVQNIFYNMIIPAMVFSFISMSHRAEDSGIQIT